jgi:hypothetical protein
MDVSKSKVSKLRVTLENVITQLVDGTLDYKVAQRIINSTNEILDSIRIEMQYNKLKTEIKDLLIDYMEKDKQSNKKD